MHDIPLRFADVVGALAIGCAFGALLGAPGIRTSGAARMRSGCVGWLWLASIPSQSETWRARSGGGRFACVLPIRRPWKQSARVTTNRFAVTAGIDPHSAVRAMLTSVNP